MRQAGVDSVIGGAGTASDGDLLWSATDGNSGTASHLQNNEIGSVGFVHTSTTYERWNVPPLNYGGSAGITVEILFSATSSGAALQGARWNYGYAFGNSGEALPTLTTGSITVDVSSYTADDNAKAAIVTIPHVDVDEAAELIAFRLEREPAHVDDNFDHTIYVHRIRYVQASA